MKFKYKCFNTWYIQGLINETKILITRYVNYYKNILVFFILHIRMSNPAIKEKVNKIETEYYIDERF